MVVDRSHTAVEPHEDPDRPPVLARHDEGLAGEDVVAFLDLVAPAVDDRRSVNKGASWAVREVGTRNERLREEAIATAPRLVECDSAVAQRVGRDALAELDDDD
jgi:hypothetical protein